jgi:hypothetical protein
VAEGQRHATRSLSALAEGVGPARGRWCRPMGAWAGKRQRPCANMDNARSLDQSCVNHEFIESKPLGTRGARVLSRIFAKTRQAPGQSPPKNDEPSAVRGKWIQYWNFGRVFRHAPNALIAILLLWALAFNLLQLFIYRRLGRSRRLKDPTDTIRHIIEACFPRWPPYPSPFLGPFF